MIQTSQELKNLIPLIYQNFHMPLFLLSKDMKIIGYPQQFFELEEDYFTHFINKQDIIKYKIYTCFHENEIYFCFAYILDDVQFICIGPYFPRKITSQDYPSDFPFLKHVISPYKINDFINLPYAHHEITSQLIFIYQVITGQILKAEELKLNYREASVQPLKQENSLEQEIFKIRENPLHDFSYSYEKKIINYIQSENSTAARILMSELMQIKDERQLSQSQIQSIKYKLVAVITLFTRAVIDVGVPIAKAYTLSDVYIMKVDQAQSIDQLHKSVSDAIIDFTKLVKRYKNIQNPHWVKECKNYISHHLHQSISLNDLADLVDMNPSYLSTQFKKVTHQSIKQYINEKKVQEAQFLIQTSHYSLAEISDILQFSSQSHFHKVFKAVTGLSPSEYKNKH